MTEYTNVGKIVHGKKVHGKNALGKIYTHTHMRQIKIGRHKNSCGLSSWCWIKYPTEPALSSCEQMSVRMCQIDKAEKRGQREPHTHRQRQRQRE